MQGIFSLLQRIGRSFMLPIAVLPMAGILLGVGGAFTNPVLIQTYDLTWLAQGTLLNQFLVLCFQAGLFVFANLPLLFAVGVAIGMAKSNKETAALSAVLGFLLMHTIIGVILGFQNKTPDNTTVQALIDANINAAEAAGLAAMYAKELGIFTLQTGVLGGIIVGLVSAWITNRFSQKTLPDYLAFFSGSRLVPVLTMIFFLPIGMIIPFVWPTIFKAVVHAGELFSSMGYIGTFFYGFTMRALNVFGLHHAIYPLFWYTELGGTLEVAGKMVSGGQKIFFAQLADPTVTHFSSEATRTMTGGFLPMMWGLPAAALAMYRCADEAHRSKVKAIMISAALTSFLTGITEPLEFTFLFAAPILYVLHAALEGLAYMLMHMLDVSVGITFSRGLIDFTFFGLLQGNEKTSYYWILLLGPIYAVVYYFLFSFLIKKFNLSTPGRNETEAKLYNRADYNAKKESANPNPTDTALPLENDILTEIVAALGGVENINDIDACITRLRITVKSVSAVASDDVFKALNAKGVIRSGNGLQLIYGTQADIYKNEIIARYGLS
jgi:PTS system maltose and glucose-specific IIC component